VKGRVKQAGGTITGNKDLEAEGAADRAGGKVEEGVGKARRKTGEWLDRVGDKLK
jgi:uncharacterized protein YjbJ (UPF0337 family)